MRPAPPLSQLPDSTPADKPNTTPTQVKLSDILKVDIQNHTKYDSLSVQLDELQKWILDQKKLFDSK